MLSLQPKLHLTQNLLRFLIASPCYRRLVAVAYEQGLADGEIPLNLRALNSFGTTPRQFPLELKLEGVFLGALEGFGGSNHHKWGIDQRTSVCQTGYLEMQIGFCFIMLKKTRILSQLSVKRGRPWAALATSSLPYPALASRRPSVLLVSRISLF